MNNLSIILPLLALQSTIFININTGFFTDSDTLKLLWNYLFVLPFLFIYGFKYKIKYRITWPVLAISFIIIISVISTAINNQINPYFYHDLGVAILALIVLVHFQETEIERIWPNLIKVTIVAIIAIFLFTVLSVEIYKYDPNTILLGNRNLTANYLIISLPVLIYSIFFGNNFIKFFSLLSIVSLVLLIIFYYPSRFAMAFSLLVIIGYSSLLIRKLNTKMKILVFGVFFTIISLALFNFSRFDRIINFSGYEDRFLVYQIAFEAFKNKFIFGYGLGSTAHVVDNFRIYYQEYSIFFDDTQFGQLHNEPIQYLIEGGIFAFTSYLLFLFLICLNFVKILNKNKFTEINFQIGFALSLSILIGLLHSLVDIGIKSPFNRAYLFLLIGIFFSLTRRSNNS